MMRRFGSKIKVIIEERDDAVGLCNRYLCEELVKLDKDLVEVIRVRRRIDRHIKDLLMLFFKISVNDVLLFTDPKSVKANMAFFLRNEKYIVVHHLDKEPLYYRLIPFLGIMDLIDRFDRIICDSRFTRQRLVDGGILGKKIVVVYEGIDTKLFRPRRNMSGLPKSYILSVGTELPRKNIDGILRVFAVLKHDFPCLRLVKVGRARNGDRQRTMRMIDELKLNDDVIFAGYVEDKDLPKYYSGARFLLFPSFLEGFGLPILEAMACGCPVVTSDRGSMRELSGGTQLLVDPRNVKDMVKKCKCLLLDQRRRSRQIKAGFERVKDFSWQKTAKGVYDVVNSGLK